MQALAEGGLSERARLRAEELANDADLRTTSPKEAAPPPTVGLTKTVAARFAKDRRLPMPGAVLAREYKGRTVQVRVLADGFEFVGEVYRTLTAAVKAITGSHWNGYHFFGMEKRGGRS